MNEESKRLPESRHLRRELVLRLDRKQRHEARRAGKRLAVDADSAKRLGAEREAWIQVLAAREEVRDEAMFTELVKDILAFAELTEDARTALRPVTWSDVVRARATG